MGRALALCVIAAVFAAASIAKVVYPLQTVRVLVFLFPGLAKVPWLTLSIPGMLAGLEFGLTAALLHPRLRRVSLVAVVILLIAFSAVLALLLAAPGRAPGCGCFGVPKSAPGGEHIAGLLRNAGLICAAVWLLRTGHRREASARSRAATPSITGVPAFTLLEMMTSIVIISILFALVLPAFAKSRSSARLAAQSSLARQLTAALALYGSDHRDAHPYFGTPGDPLGPVRIRDFTVPMEYFKAQRWLWASAVYPEYIDAPRSAIEPRGRAPYMTGQLLWPDSIVAAEFQLTSTAFARPSFWTGGDDGPYSQVDLRHTTNADLAFPSLKGLIATDLAGPAGWPEGDEMVVGLGDGSGRTVLWRLLDPVAPVCRPWGAACGPIESTRDGLRGVDF